MLKIKNIAKIRTIVIKQVNIEMLHITCNLKYSMPREIYIASHNGSNYDYYFIIKELAEEVEGQFTCLRENNKKYINFSVLIIIDKSRKKITKTISYRLRFIDNAKFMASSLSNLVNNPAE